MGMGKAWAMAQQVVCQLNEKGKLGLIQGKENFRAACLGRKLEFRFFQAPLNDLLLSLSLKETSEIRVQNEVI